MAVPATLQVKNTFLDMSNEPARHFRKLRTCPSSILAAVERLQVEAQESSRSLLSAASTEDFDDLSAEAAVSDDDFVVITPSERSFEVAHWSRPSTVLQSLASEYSEDSRVKEAFCDTPSERSVEVAKWSYPPGLVLTEALKSMESDTLSECKVEVAQCMGPPGLALPQALGSMEVDEPQVQDVVCDTPSERSFPQAGDVDFLFDEVHCLETQVMPEPAAAVLSVGSLLHAVGGCRPCAWFWKLGGCSKKESCAHCHLCLPGALEKHTAARRRARMLKRQQERNQTRRRAPACGTPARLTARCV